MSQYVQPRNDGEQATGEASNNSPRVNFAEYFAVVGLGPVELQQQVKDTKIGLNLNDLKQPAADTTSAGESTGRNRATSRFRLYGNTVGNIFEKVFKAHIIDRYPYESGNESKRIQTKRHFRLVCRFSVFLMGTNMFAITGCPHFLLLCPQVLVGSTFMGIV